MGFLFMFLIYIIFSAKLNRYYVGYTEGIEKHLSEHNSGISSFTSKAGDWELMYTETYPSREEAMKREREIKSKKSRNYLEWLIASQ